jgi:DNA-binding beta-propeller fold protein YncE
MKLALIALTAALALPVTAQAQQIAALSGYNALEIVDVEARRATDHLTITGVDGPIAGIDVRPADGALYALSFSGAVYIIDTATGVATRKSQLRIAPTAGGAVTVDFNPVANRLRIITASGANLRANVDDGGVTKDGDIKMAGAAAPTVIAGAYTNAKAGATETTLFDIDSTGRFLKQAPPNEGALIDVGALGASPATIAFDIVTGADGANTGMAIAGGKLHTIDLTTGAATALGRIRGLRGDIRDIAILPAK